MPGPSWLSAWGRRGWRAQSLYGVSTWRWPSCAETSRNQGTPDPGPTTDPGRKPGVPDPGCEPGVVPGDPGPGLAPGVSEPGVPVPGDPGLAPGVSEPGVPVPGDPGLAPGVSGPGGSWTSYSRFGLTPWITERPPRRQSASIVSSLALPAAKLYRGSEPER